MLDKRRPKFGNLIILIFFVTASDLSVFYLICSALNK